MPRIDRALLPHLVTPLLALGVPAAALAETVSIAITAEVAEVEDQHGVLDGLLFPGQGITGRYVYESTTKDTNPAATVGDYWHRATPSEFRVEAGSLVFQTDPDHVEVLVELAHNNVSIDSYLVISYHNRSSLERLGIGEIVWQLDDPSRQVLSSTALPVEPPNLPDWQSWYGLTLQGTATDRQVPVWFVRAHVTSAVREDPAGDDSEALEALSRRP